MYQIPLAVSLVLIVLEWASRGSNCLHGVVKMMKVRVLPLCRVSAENKFWRLEYSVVMEIVGCDWSVGSD